MSYSMPAYAGFGFDSGESAAFSLGVTITKTNTQSTCNTYIVFPKSDGQLWEQQLMVQQEQQIQTCHKYHYGANGIHCGAWSAYINTDIPVQNGVSFGWSTGYNNMDFGLCRQQPGKIQRDFLQLIQSNDLNKTIEKASLIQVFNCL